MSENPNVTSGHGFAWRLGATVFVVLALLALWQLRDLVLLVFAAILFAIALRALSGFVAKVPKLGDGPAFLVAALAVVLAIGLFFSVLGTQLQAQLVQIADQLPELLAPLENWLGVDDIGDWLMERGDALFSETALMSRIAGLSGWVASIVANLVLVVVAGFYIGYRPDLYAGGFLLLFPGGMRARAQRTLNALDAALGLWLLGQFAAMVAVGTLTFIGLWALGIESALALAFIAAILEFIPFVGPLLAAVPALAIALSMDMSTALWVLALYLAIQQLEGNMMSPLIQQRAVALPPAANMFALLAFGILFGPLGLLLATPLAVVCLVVVKQLWVRDTLGEDVSLPGSDDEAREG